MSLHVFDVLQERGFIAQVTDEKDVRRLLDEEKITFYVGFDSTATSLHAGSLVPIMAMMHLQRAGNRPIAIVGGGTTMVGDPSGRDEMRQLLTEEAIRANGKAIHAQLNRYLHFDEEKALALDNADWLLPLGYVQFLREIGVHFSVNRMLAAEAYKQRLEKGLSFIEFNYQLLQAYDYLFLYKEYGCKLQMGGDDQWGNILAGVDLIRRVSGAKVKAMTFPLLTTASGAKMGKSATGAVWLDGERLSPYDFFQYWINCDDRDVPRFLKMFTFLPKNEIDRLAALQGSKIREAKRILAFEATKVTHGESAAQKAMETAEAAFGDGGTLEAMPVTQIPAKRLASGVSPLDLFTEVGLTSSRGEAKRLVKQGGMYVNDKRVESIEARLDEKDLAENGILLRAGKKKYHRIVVT
ncbi:MAG: tyrosine--tRNA ligase [Candidatus Aminicenantes bacterium]|nr:tyrosine--tRNA ligase [Candidatus Aminicenantes bacterium]